jgi:hypothetical protein
MPFRHPRSRQVEFKAGMAARVSLGTQAQPGSTRTQLQKRDVSVSRNLNGQKPKAAPS